MRDHIYESIGRGKKISIFVFCIRYLDSQNPIRHTAQQRNYGSNVAKSKTVCNNLHGPSRIKTYYKSTKLNYCNISPLENAWIFKIKMCDTLIFSACKEKSLTFYVVIHSRWSVTYSIQILMNI